MVGIVRTEDVLGGEPRLEGRRISVLQIADLVLDAGHSVEYVADQLDVSLADVHSALAYYYEHADEMHRIRARHRELESILASRTTSPRRPDA